MRLIGRNDSPPHDELLDALQAALQADVNDEAIYGWMVEESETAGVIFVEENGEVPGVRLTRSG